MGSCASVDCQGDESTCATPFGSCGLKHCGMNCLGKGNSEEAAEKKMNELHDVVAAQLKEALEKIAHMEASSTKQSTPGSPSLPHLEHELAGYVPAVVQLAPSVLQIVVDKL